MLGIGVGTGRQGGCVYEAILMVMHSEDLHGHGTVENGRELQDGAGTH